MSLIEGSLVADRFVVESLAGKGGMGEVFRARDTATGRRVALKLLPPHTNRPDEIERFSREARLLSELRHPGIVSYLSHGEIEDGRPFLAIEWLAGQDLAKRLASGPLSLHECVTLLAKVTDALAAAHRRGIMHRDIKPSNLFLRDNRIERVTLLDFGIARQVLATNLTRTGQIIGTPSYMAPEQARGKRNLGLSADIFSLGCVLFECLTGRAPFIAHDIIAALVKILFGDAPSVDALRPDTPPPLSALLARMLDKDPARRPPDAAALRHELATLEFSLSEDTPAPPRRSVVPAPAILSGDAMRLFCLVLAIPNADPPSSETDTITVGEPWSHPLRDALRTRLTRLGGRVEWLADGSLAVIVPPSESAIDQAAQAARCALAIKELWPKAVVALTTGRGLLKNRLPVSKAIDRGASLLRMHNAPSTQTCVWLDELSAKLLEPRFAITMAQNQPALHGNRLDADASRPLLGRPTPCVGREQDLAILSAALHGCIENAQPLAALVIAPPGMGKSRLKHEFLRRLRAQSIEVELLSGSGAPMNAGSPYGLLGEALRRLCGIEIGDPPALAEEKIRGRVSRHVPLDDAARVGEFIAALCGVPVEAPSVVLRAARSDPQIMTEQIQRAFVDFLGAECAARPYLLVLEDLHWGDPGTVRLIDAALRELGERPLFVVAFARPEVNDRFPRLWEGRAVQRMQLSGLSRKAAERLIVEVLGKDVPVPTVAHLVEQAAGNALFLEELIRAAAEGKVEEQPDTVLAMLQARLSCLDTEARRVLCAASVFGRNFWRGGVRALLGQELDTQQTEGWLVDLVQSEIIEKQRDSRFPEETEYKFRHALVRDAAYGLLPEGDRTLGHRLAGVYLEQVGEGDPMVLAEHANRGGELERAALYYALAAEQSYQANDHDGLLSRVEQGLACNARGEVRGRLLALKLETCLWRQDWQTGLRIGKEALMLLPRGGVWWNKAVTPFFLMAGHANQTEELAALVNALTTNEPDPDAIPAYCMAAAMVVATLSIIGVHEPSRALLERLSQLAPVVPESEAFEYGHIHNGRNSYGYFLGQDPWQTYVDAKRAELAFGRACASRWNETTEMMLAISLGALGQHVEAEQKLRGCLERTLRSNDAFTISGARLFLMLVLVENESRASEHQEEIAALAKELIALDAMENTVGAAHSTLARVMMVEGRLHEAREEAEKALGIFRHFVGWRPAVYATLVEIHLREGRADTARQVAEKGLACLESLGGSCHGDIPLRLAVAEARATAGDMDAAREALAETLRAIETRASKIPDPAIRTRYLDGIPAHVRARELRVDFDTIR